MTNNNRNKKFNRKSHRDSNTQNADRRETDRREQSDSDRREIERFGYEIMSRRSGGDRRDNQ